MQMKMDETPVIQGQKFTWDVQSNVDASNKALRDSVLTDIKRTQENIQQLKDAGISTKIDEQRIKNLQRLHNISNSEIGVIAKSETPTSAIPKEIPVAPVKEVTPPITKSEPTPMLNAEPAVAAIKKAKKITKKGEAPKFDSNVEKAKAEVAFINDFVAKSWKPASPQMNARITYLNNLVNDADILQKIKDERVAEPQLNNDQKKSFQQLIESGKNKIEQTKQEVEMEQRLTKELADYEAKQTADTARILSEQQAADAQRFREWILKSVKDTDAAIKQRQEATANAQRLEQELAAKQEADIAWQKEFPQPEPIAPVEPVKSLQTLTTEAQLEKSKKLVQQKKWEAEQKATLQEAQFWELPQEAFVQPVKTLAEVVSEATQKVTPEWQVIPPDLEFKTTQYKNVKNVDSWIDTARKQSEWDYAPEFKIGDITKALPTIAGAISRNFNLSRFLDNIRVKVGEKFVPVWWYMEWAMRSLRSNIKDSIVWQFEGNLKNIDGKMKASVDKTDLLWTKTTQDIEVTPNNVDTFLKSYENIDYYDKKLPGLTQKQTNELVKASYIYDLVKQKWPEITSKYFTPDQIKAFDALEAMEKDVYGSTSKKASDDQVYEGELNPDYIHFDMIRKNFERLPKTEQEWVTVTIDGENVRFDNYLDAIDALDRAKRLGKKIDADTFVWLEQKKSSNIIDPMRTHWALGRLLSYADWMGKAYSDQKVVNIFNDLQKAGIDKKTNQRIQDYLGWLNARGIKNPAEQMLAYTDNSTIAKISQGLSSVGSQAAITFNPKTYTQWVLSAWLKNTVDSLGSFWQNLLSVRPKAALADLISWGTGLAKTIANTALALGKKEIGNMTRAQKITDVLVRDGFVTWLEIWDRNLGTAFEISSGLVQENAAKADVALRGMRRALLSNWYKDVYTPEWIAKSWDQFRDKNVNEYIQAREQIRQDTRLIADVSRQSRLTTLGLYNTAWALKTYMLGVINQSTQDASTLVNAITNKVGADKLVEAPEVINSIRRLSLVYWAYLAAEQLVEEGLEAQGYVYEELSEEWKALYDSIKKNYAKRISATPDSMLNDLAGWLVSNVGLSKAYTLFNDIWQAVTELGQSNNDKRYSELGLDILNAGARFFAAWNAVNEAYSLYSPDNETGLDALSATAWLPGRWNQTRYGLATWQNSDSKVESFMNMLGFKQDQAVLDHLYGMKSDLEMQSDIPDPIKRAAVIWLKSQGQRIAQSNFPVISDIASQLSGTEKSIDWNGWVNNRLKSQYAYEATDRLMNGEAKTLTEFLTLNWIDPQWKQFINQAINNRVETIAGKLPKANKTTGELSEGTGNEQVEWTINNFLDPRIWARDDRWVLDNWKDMQTKNPKLFNDTMAFIWWLALAEDERKAKGLDIDLDYIKKIGKDWKLEPNDPLALQIFDKDVKTISDSTAQDDKAIADILGTPALKTSFTEAVADTLGKYGDYIKSEGKEWALSRLDKLENLTKVIMENSQFTNGYINALSLMNFDTKSALRSLAKLWVTADVIQNRFPALYDSLINALSLRGEDTDKSEKSPTLSSIVQKTWTWGGKWYTSDISLPDITWWIIADKKKQVKFELPSGWKVPKVWGVWAQKSLAELLNSPWMKQAMSRWWQLQTREPLATFSKSLNQR